MLNLYHINKWWKMLTGNSVDHALQGVGQCFVPGEKGSGYFNDLTQKVLMQPELLETEKLPKVTDVDDSEVEFPVAIIQYGFGAYDLYRMTNDDIYLTKFWQCVKWVLDKQKDNGSVENFSMFKGHIAPYSAMCQGEMASLFVRAFYLSGNGAYLESAKKAIEFMLIPVEKGGTTQYEDGKMILLEFTASPPVLNGWIFALIGLYDISLFCDKYENTFKVGLESLVQDLHSFDTGYWSYYSISNRITSPFYHKLHIAQLEALLKIDNNKTIKLYYDLFKQYDNNYYNKARSFALKAYQKLKENMR